jgi:hypothetical protein
LSSIAETKPRGLDAFTTDPLEADDWLRSVEKQHNIAQCNDQQKVLFASGQL